MKNCQKIFLLLLILSCESRIEFNIPEKALTNASCIGVVERTISHVDTYTGASNFNDYLENNESDIFSADGTICNADAIVDGGSNNGSSNGIHSCFHSGIMKSFVLEKNSCDGLSITDNLDVLNWRCMIKNGNAQFVSVGIKEGMGLSDLLNADSWKSISINIKKNGCDLYRSNPAKLWENPVRNLDTLNNIVGGLSGVQGVVAVDPNAGPSAVAFTLDNTASTNGGVIYTINSDVSYPGFNLNEDKVALVVLNNAKLSFAANGNNCSAIPQPDLSANTECIVTSYQNNFLWVEGRFDSDGAQANHGLYFRDTPFSQLRKIEISDVSTYGFFPRSQLMNIQDISIFDTSNLGMNMQGDHYVMFNVRVAHTGGVGAIFADNISDSKFIKVSTDSAANGLLVSQGDRNSILGLHSTGNINRNLNIYSNANNNTFVNTFLSGSNNSLDLEDSDQNTFHDLISINGVGNITLSGGFIGVTNFEGELLADGVTGCTIAGTTNIDANCDGAGVSFFDTGDLSSSFVGLITSDPLHDLIEDISNPVTYSSIIDWHQFENKYRRWLRDTGSPDILQNSGICAGVSSCRVWDFSLKSNDTTLLGVHGDFPTSSSAECPSSVHGNETITNSEGEVFLTAAREIFNDGFGDDDGLCESSEHCLFMPNYSSYQGHGELLKCQFNDDSETTNVVGVTMFGHSLNGR